MAQRELVALNESTPQLEAAQSGDTYYLVRDMDVATGIKIVATAGQELTFKLGDNAGANFADFQDSDGTSVLRLNTYGGIDHQNSGASTEAAAQSVNLNWTSSSTKTSSGQYSTVQGLNNTASASYTRAMGSNCTASANGAVASGSGVTVTGQHSYAHGESFTNAGDFSVAFGRGTQITSGGDYSLGTGYQASVANRHTIGIGGAKYTTDGDVQVMTACLRASTTDATQTTMLAGTTNYVIPADTTWAFSALISARSDETDGNQSAAYKLVGCLARDESNSTVIVGAVTKTVIAEDIAAWDVTAEAETSATSPAGSYEGLAIKVTGEAATNIRWVCRLSISQVSFA